MKTIRMKTDLLRRYPLLKNKRSLIWKKAKGLWKNRRQDPILELNKMRNEWN